jgi:cation transport protein ChaC
MSWIFAYGSLLFKPDFPFVERVAVQVEGFCRRFHQASTVYRGTPERPGRVLTLVHEPDQRCTGLAYRVAEADVASTLAALAVRERDHELTRVRAQRLDGGGSIDDCIAYVAIAGNRNYLGPATVSALVAQIAGARGQAGSNADYLHQLADKLRELDLDDPHVFELDALVRARTQELPGVHDGDAT